MKCSVLALCYYC